VSDRRTGGGGTKLSPPTLIVASLASLTAAIVVSTFWKGGTPIAAAMTPVIVAVASELYSRPARRITELSSRASAARSRRFAEQSVREHERVLSGGAPPERGLPVQPPDDAAFGPMRVYRTERPSSPIRRVHIRLALITALLAFVIATAVLTLPELVFGGSVASHGRTTIFGGTRHRHKSSSSDQNKSTTTQQSPTSSTPSSSTTTPSPSTTTPVAPQSQTAPSTTTPAPSTTTPVTPQSQTPTTPAPTP
jgi:hypothetical protein